MENSYRIGVANRYALFMDKDLDALETVNIKEEKIAKKIKEKPESTKANPIKPINKDKKIQDKKSEDDKEKHKKSIENKFKREEKNNKRDDNTLNNPDNKVISDMGDNSETRRNKFKNPESRHNDKRNFDRQSGSDKTTKPIYKRDGNGARNWGPNKSPIEEPVTIVEPTNATETIENIEAPINIEPNVLTLDEWKAQTSEHKKPTYNIRKAGEGEDPTQWKTMYELIKKQAKSDDEEFDSFEYPQRAGRQKRVLGIDFNFVDGRRGGRGGHGGRGGRDARRDNRDKQIVNDEPTDMNTERDAPKVYDERDFPSLG